MKKSLLFLVIGIIFLALLFGLSFKFFIGEKGREALPTEKISEKEKLLEEEKISENLLKGLGFKKGAYSVYKALSSGQDVQRVKLVMDEINVGGKDYFGVEAQTDDMGNFFMLWSKENNQPEPEIVGAKDPKGQLVCVDFAQFGVSLWLKNIERENIEKEYKIEDEFSFDGRDKFTLESGKTIDVLKFSKSIVMDHREEAWFSENVPFYFVKAAEIQNNYSQGHILVDFGLDGEKFSFTSKEAEKCKEGTIETKIPGASINLPEVNKLLCQVDSDCACGVDKETGKCAYGNKNFIDTSKQCPDFCTGIGGFFQIKCVDNICQSLPKSGQ